MCFACYLVVQDRRPLQSLRDPCYNLSTGAIPPLLGGDWPGFLVAKSDKAFYKQLIGRKRAWIVN